MKRESFDAVVLGAGSAGLAHALRAARHGAKVALVDPGALGGTCVNVGCVPKKAMWIAAERVGEHALAASAGFGTPPAGLDWPAWIARREAYIARIHESYSRRLDEAGIACVAEAGRFVGARMIDTVTRRLEGRHVIIATGARPRRPSVPGADLGIDSNGFFGLRALPRRVAIAGGGYIAVELSGILRALGAEVELVVRGQRLLDGFDDEVAEVLATRLQAHGIGIVHGREIAAVERAGANRLNLRFDDGARRDDIDVLLWATGRRPNSEGLGLDAGGVAVDARGHVRVDEWQDTNVAGVHALGDITGRLALTPVATASARCLADRLFGGKPNAKLDYANVPTVVFFTEPLGSVGLSEREARARFGDVVSVHRTRFTPMRHRLVDVDRPTFMKLVCAGTDERVVGIHMIGHAVDEILQGFAVAVKLGARKADLDATVAIHPTSAEELVLMR
ncbi:MAG: glutathione-disulfide reductase [Xanthomonadales bacterium]|nr:glutathione-disulfide reductase [Xanthomonadales bacterium]